MKAKCFLYHVECFKCVMCDVPLMKGDLFGMFEAVVYCQTHYQEQREQLFSQDFAIQNFYGCEADGGLPAHLVHPSSSLLSGGSGMGSSPWPPGTSPDSEYHTDTSISPTTKKKRGRRKRELSEDEASRGSCFPYIDPNTGLLEKTKRARTSFKHHQLRIMKSHFQMNQNPDSRELKELATKTGLDKKVLQVCIYIWETTLELSSSVHIIQFMTSCRCGSKTPVPNGDEWITQVVWHPRLHQWWKIRLRAWITAASAITNLPLANRPSCIQFPCLSFP